jgi:hypothetical protein
MKIILTAFFIFSVSTVIAEITTTVKTKPGVINLDILKETDKVKIISSKQLSFHGRANYLKPGTILISDKLQMAYRILKIEKKGDEEYLLDVERPKSLFEIFENMEINGESNAVPIVEKR